MIQTFIKEIRVIQWDGTTETLEELKALYPNDLRAFITNGTTPPSLNSLRLTLIKYQGDYWIDVGEYIELKKDRVSIWQKDLFEETFKIKE